MTTPSCITLTILTTICSILHGFTQTTYTRVVADSITHTGVPFATIKVKHKAAGIYSNESGQFKITLAQNDSVVVSSVGYRTRELSLSDLDTVWLAGMATLLEEVVIADERKLTVCGIRERKGSLSFGAQFGGEYVVKIALPDTTQQYILNKVTFLTNRKINDEVLQLRIYDTGDDGLPGEQLLKRPVTITRKMLHGNGTDISDQAITCQKYIFVGIEWTGTISERIDSPFLLKCTDALPIARTYVRTILDPEYQWRLVSSATTVPSKTGNPFNIIASVEVFLVR